MSAGFMLSGCVGVHIGFPVGPIQVEALVAASGDVGVAAGISTPFGSVGVSGQMPKEQGVFEEVPASEESGFKAEQEKGKK